ncbi:MAG: hypothetical protein WCP39_07255 [Chlamydiota bacterium]
MSIQPTSVTQLPRDALSLIGSLTHELHPSKSLPKLSFQRRKIYYNI